MATQEKAAKPVGRPPKRGMNPRDSRSIGVRLFHDQIEALAEVAKRHAMDRAQLIRLIIDDGLDRIATDERIISKMLCARI